MIQSALKQAGVHQGTHFDPEGWAVQGIAIRAAPRTVIREKERTLWTFREFPVYIVCILHTPGIFTTNIDNYGAAAFLST